jgi:hypothetical protein
MKTWTPLAILTFLLCTSTELSGQIHMGMRGGLGSFNMKVISPIDNAPVDSEYRTGHNYALFFNATISGNLSFQTELGYIEKGYSNESAPFGFRAEYVEAPVLLKYSFGKGLWSSFLEIGPTIAYGPDIFTATSIEYNPDGSITTYIIHLDYGTILQNFEIGAVGGLGVQINTTLGSFFLYGRYAQGIRSLKVSKVNNEDEQFFGRNYGFYGGIGYIFQITRSQD